MRRLVMAIVMAGVLAAGVLAAGGSSAGTGAERGPFRLVSLASLGTVTWRCDPSRRPGLARELPGLALGFRAFARSATTRVRLRADRRTVLSRRVDPGEHLLLPYLHARVQRIALEQFTGAGTIRATITATFARGSIGPYCWGYQPPRLAVRMSPRR